MADIAATPLFTPMVRVQLGQRTVEHQTDNTHLVHYFGLVQGEDKYFDAPSVHYLFGENPELFESALGTEVYRDIVDSLAMFAGTDANIQMVLQ